MEYAAHLPSSRSVMVPLLALAIGAGGAVGVYAALDESEVGIPQTRVVVTQPLAPPSEGVAAKDEAGTAAAIAAARQPAFEGKDEAATAAVIVPAPRSDAFKGKDEAATAAAIARPEADQTVTSSPRTWLESKDEAGTAAAIGGGPPAESRDDGADIRTDPHGPANGLR